MVAEADVVIENFSPGVMARLGLSAAEVHAINPRCVYLSLPGFASTDEKRAGYKAWEAVIMAVSGVYADMGVNRALMGVKASYSPLPLASAYSSVIGALGVTLALLGRESSGKGDRIEVPLAAGLCDALIYNSMDVPALPKRYLTLRELEIARCEALNMPMAYDHKQIKELLDPFYHTYDCKDGRPFYVVAPCHGIHQRRVLEALGVWDEMVALDLPVGYDVYEESENWGEGVHTVLGTYPLTDPGWISTLKTAMRKAFLARPAAEWERIFMALKIPGAGTKTTEEWIHSEHALASGLIKERQWVENGPSVREAGPVVWLDRSAVPSTQEQREAFLASSQRDASQREATAGSSPWLSGVRVVDLSNVIAGPTIGGVLSRFGATVVKVDAQQPTYDALVAVFMGVPINTGKTSLLADLRDVKDGKEILRRLVEWADVVVTNQVSSQHHTLGVDQPSLKSINPHVIHCNFDAYGGPGWGPRSDAIGYDDLLQASTGIMARFGGGLETPEEHAHLGTIDVISGFSGALSTAMALLKRQRTGQADVARTSLAANAQHIQTPFMYDYEGRGPFDEASGPTATGEHALYRWYKTVDSHVFIAGYPEDGDVAALQASSKALEVAGILTGFVSLSPEEGAIAMQTALEGHTASSAATLLSSAGITAVPLSSLAMLREKHPSPLTSFGHGGGSSHAPHTSDDTFHFNTVQAHPIGSPVTMLSPCSILSSTQAVPIPSPAPKYGENSRAVLRETLGYSDAEIEGLVARKIVSDGWSQRYLPTGDPWAKVKAKHEEYIERVRRGEAAFIPERQ